MLLVNPKDYFDIPALSASGINKFLLKSPLHFWEGCAFNPNRVQAEPTDEMCFGILCHAILFEPERLEEDFAVSPKFDRRTKVGKADSKQFEKLNDGKTIVSEEDYSKAHKMIEALRKNSAAFKLIGNGCPEMPIMWGNGLKRKAKLDYSREGLILDYKTATDADINSFERSVIKYGYHRQAAWYMEGVEATTGERPRGFVNIVQDKDTPGAVGIYSMPEDFIQQGHRENQWAARQIERRLENGDWKAFREEIVGMTMPTWYKSPINNFTGEIYE